MVASPAWRALLGPRGPAVFHLTSVKYLQKKRLDAEAGPSFFKGGGFDVSLGAPAGAFAVFLFVERGISAN